MESRIEDLQHTEVQQTTAYIEGDLEKDLAETRRDLQGLLVEHLRVRNGADRRIRGLVKQVRQLNHQLRRCEEDRNKVIDKVMAAQKQVEELEGRLASVPVALPNPVTSFEPSVDHDSVYCWVTTIMVRDAAGKEKWIDTGAYGSESEANKQADAMVLLGEARPAVGQRTLKYKGACALCGKQVRDTPHQEPSRWMLGRLCHDRCLQELGRTLGHVAEVD